MRKRNGRKTKRVKGGLFGCTGLGCVELKETFVPAPASASASISVVPTIASAPVSGLPKKENNKDAAVSKNLKVYVKEGKFGSRFIIGDAKSNSWNKYNPLERLDCIKFKLNGEDNIGKIIDWTKVSKLSPPDNKYISHITYAPWKKEAQEWDNIKKEISFFKGEEATGDCATIEKVNCPTRLLDEFKLDESQKYRVGDIVNYTSDKWQSQTQPSVDITSSPTKMKIIRIEADTDESHLKFSDKQAYLILRNISSGDEDRVIIGGPFKPNIKLITESKGGKHKRTNKKSKKSKKSKRKTHRR